LTGIRSFLFVIDHLSSGGAQQQMVLLAKQLAGRGHCIRFLVYRRHDFHAIALSKRGITVECVKGMAGRFSVIGRIRQILRTERPDGVLSFLAGPNAYAILGRMAARSSVPLVISQRSSPDNPNRQLLHSLAEGLYRYADRIVTNSHHMRAHMQARFPRLAEKVVTIWNGVDPDRFRATLVPGVADGFRFICIGQIGAFKRPEYVIRSLARLRDEYGIAPQVNWFARRYPDLTPVEQKELERLNRIVAELGVGNQFHWEAETPEIAAEIAGSHGLIHASVVEGLPNAVCESLACGRPVLASNVLDHPKLVRHGETGFLFEADSPTGLVEALRNYCQLDDGSRLEMGRRAAAFASEHLSAATMADRYLSLFAGIAGRNA
jgi:GalNAc-alpha-(1->4)-GalNAc-alpha-(1->3)-diNAcBac-PP-undecaprenol alpha-1,4-N-acetyl-D-galactosaminyltransferase